MMKTKQTVTLLSHLLFLSGLTQISHKRLRAFLKPSICDNHELESMKSIRKVNADQSIVSNFVTGIPMQQGIVRFSDDPDRSKLREDALLRGHIRGS
jgi:hypothetical protein